MNNLLKLPIALGVFAFGSFASSVGAEIILPDTITLVSQAFEPPNEGEPVVTLGGATRGTCSSLSSSDDVQFFQQEHRSILQVVLPPYLATEVFFNVRNAQGQTLYQGIFPVDVTRHSVSIPVSELVPLRATESYNWSLAILCQSNILRPDSPVYKGKW